MSEALDWMAPVGWAWFWFINWLGAFLVAPSLGRALKQWWQQ